MTSTGNALVATSAGDTALATRKSPTELNAFVEDLLEQMVRRENY